MGMHIGLAAAKVPVTVFRESILRAWPEFKVVAQATLPNEDAMWAWKKKHEQFVSAAEWSKSNRGRTVYVFWQDGSWTLLMDETYVLASDEEKLSVLSHDVGTVLSLVVETTGASAMFWCFEQGQLRRAIDYADGKVTKRGEPLPQEGRIIREAFCMAEAEALWKTFGMSAPGEFASAREFQAISVVDRTNYEIFSPASAKPKKPWWRFWCI